VSQEQDWKVSVRRRRRKTWWSGPIGVEVGCRPIDGGTTINDDNVGDDAGDSTGDSSGERPTGTPCALSRWSAMLANA
jgi:hypothetical protein